jgi:hypothetical protein
VQQVNNITPHGLSTLSINCCSIHIRLKNTLNKKSPARAEELVFCHRMIAHLFNMLFNSSIVLLAGATLRTGLIDFK